MDKLPPSPFVVGIPAAETDHPAESRFVLDELAFFEAIEPVPLFLRPVIELLAGYA